VTETVDVTRYAAKTNSGEANVPKKVFLSLLFPLFVSGQAFAGAYQAKILYSLGAPPGATNWGVENPNVNYGTTTAAGQTIGFSDQGLVLWTPTSIAVLAAPGMSQVEPGGATNGSQQVGYGLNSASGNYNALVFNGTSASEVNLEPTNLSGCIGSQAYGTNGSQQVGEAFGPSSEFWPQAMLWSGTPGSAVNLNPVGITNSVAYGLDATQQVGYGWGSSTSGADHALLWTSSAGTAVDLNPNFFGAATQSVAVSVSGSDQVGYEYAATDQDHAVLWTGSVASAVDLNPTDLSGINYSAAYATNGIDQVGYGYNNTTIISGNALLWSGTADSAVNLQTLLPATGTWFNSYAFWIDPAGNVYGTAQGINAGAEATFSLEWSPVPEPATGSLVLIGGAGVFMRRCRKRWDNSNQERPR
jgi:hypothetical protein